MPTINNIGSLTSLKEEGTGAADGQRLVTDVRAAKRILLVDDRMENRESMGALLASGGYLVQVAASVPEALARLRVGTVELVLTDVRMDADDDGLSLLRAIKGDYPNVPVIVYTGFATIRDAVLATRLGAADYLELPIDSDFVLRAVANASGGTCVRPGPLEAPNLIAASPAMRSVVKWVERIARAGSTALLTGETGTGKELVAKALHSLSPRRAAPFVAVNCGAIPEGLFESELFGYRKGAFTGAVADKPGLVEEAHGGTLFLDEIADLPPSMQVRLLRFLEDGEVRRLGQTKVRHVDIRLIAATNRQLHDEAAAGRFRLDLFYRINVARCEIPSLRDRHEDLDALIAFWLSRAARQSDHNVVGISDSARALLRAYSWPGNVRELRNVLEYAVSLATGDQLSGGDVVTALGIGPLNDHSSVKGGRPEEPGERGHLMALLEQHRWNQTRVANTLGMSRTTLWRKLRDYGLRRRDQDL
jgi:DNA-binding NtrC family response regulator